MNHKTFFPKKISFKCEVCGNEALSSVLDLGEHPLCDDLIPVGNNRICKTYPIRITFCDRCNTAHQEFQVPKQTLFPSTYHYRSRFTEDVLLGMSSLVEACEARLGSLKNKLILDIGCNDGSLLDFFKAKGAITVGIDPTDAIEDGSNKGHNLIQGYFDENLAKRIAKTHGFPEIITFTNVFAHIENLPELIAALKVLMSAHTMLVVENHYLGAVLDRFQFDTFYHEHPRTYSLTSFARIAETLGSKLTAIEFPARYGGNIRIFIGGPNRDCENLIEKAEVQKLLANEQQFHVRLLSLQEIINKWKYHTSNLISELVNKNGPLTAKAFPGRAAILIKILNLDIDSIEVVYEKPGSMKIGHYVPGTRIPIKSDDEFWALENKPPVILNLAWHISEEISTYLRKGGYVGEVIDILDVKKLA